MNAPRGIDWVEARISALDRAHTRASVAGDGERKHRVEVERDRMLKSWRRLIAKEGIAW